MRSIEGSFSRRCARCQLPPRWCVCPVHRDIPLPLAVDVVTHHRERFRPSSTGTLINRVIPGSGHLIWRRERRLTAADVRRPDRDLWILHPQGEPLPAALPDVHHLQLLLLDGSWRETSAMAQEVASWGRLVSLPMAGASRYWLRAQADEARFSTVEALLFLLQRFGLHTEHEALSLQFELHVYASLRARGHKAAGQEFLASSALRAAFPGFIAQLDVRRPRED